MPLSASGTPESQWTTSGPGGSSRCRLRGDRATTVAVAKALDVPEYRARGMLSGLRRVLAVDGFDVLGVNDDDVALDRSLLFQQFSLGTAATG